MKKFLLVLLLLAQTAFAESYFPAILEEAGARQVLVVVTPDWNSPTGTLHLYQDKSGELTPVGQDIPVVVGKNGLAWGIGLHPAGQTGLQKREGDGRAPAGIFVLSTAYGTASLAPASTTWPYQQIGRDLFCVDDAQSLQYNRMITSKASGNPWKSAETMKRQDDLYKWLVVVGHNTAPTAVPGMGSCIFLHVWRGATSGTAGCTATAEGDLIKILTWLKTNERPVLVQLPQAVYEMNRDTWGLPALPQ